MILSQLIFYCFSLLLVVIINHDIFNYKHKEEYILISKVKHYIPRNTRTKIVKNISSMITVALLVSAFYGFGVILAASLMIYTLKRSYDRNQPPGWWKWTRFAFKYNKKWHFRLLCKLRRDFIVGNNYIYIKIKIKYVMFMS